MDSRSTIFSQSLWCWPTGLSTQLVLATPTPLLSPHNTLTTTPTPTTTGVNSNRTEDQQLFWALRGGGGGNFGVVVSLTFQMQRPHPNVLWGDMCWPVEESTPVLSFYNQISQALPDNLALYGTSSLLPLQNVSQTHPQHNLAHPQDGSVTETEGSSSVSLQYTTGPTTKAWNCCSHSSHSNPPNGTPAILHSSNSRRRTAMPPWSTIATATSSQA